MHYRSRAVWIFVVSALVAGCTSTAPPSGQQPAAASAPSTATTTVRSTTGVRPTTTVPPTTAPTTTAPTGSTPPTTVPPVAAQRDTHILYSTRSAGSTVQIGRMKVDGTERVRLTNDLTAEHHWPKPSPDGRRILFYKAAPGQTVNDYETNSLWVMDADGRNQRLLLPDGAYGWTRQGHVEWSPDGTRLVMAAGTETEISVWETDTDGRSPRRLTNRRTVLGAIQNAWEPSWAPDGRSILFVGCPPEELLCLWWSQEVYRMDLRTGVEVRMTNDRFPDFDPYLSPDGTTLVWLRCSGAFPTGPWGIWSRPADGSAPATAVLDDGQINSNVDFASDGSKMVFARLVGGGTPWQFAATVRPDGTGLAPMGGQPSPEEQFSVTYWP